MEIERSYTDDMRLSWAEYQSGVPCRGCGLQLVDAKPWEMRGTMNFTDTERQRYEAEEARYRHRHGDCHSFRWSMSGSLTTHCGRCCPPSPLSPKQIAKKTLLAPDISQPKPKPR